MNATADVTEEEFCTTCRSKEKAFVEECNGEMVCYLLHTLKIS